MYVVELKALAREVGAESISRDSKVAVIHLREPVGGARVALQKSLGATPRVGYSQIRVPLRDGWKRDLVQTLEGLAAFRAGALALSGA